MSGAGSDVNHTHSNAAGVNIGHQETNVGIHKSSFNVAAGGNRSGNMKSNRPQIPVARTFTVLPAWRKQSVLFDLHWDAHTLSIGNGAKGKLTKPETISLLQRPVPIRSGVPGQT